MSRKKVYTEAFEPPFCEDVQKACEAVGGKAEASRLLKKNWCTEDRWCTGKIKIDYATWEMLKRTV
jgi:hypothetical protein